MFQRASHFADVQPQAGQPFDFAEGEINGFRNIGRVTATKISEGAPPQISSTIRVASSAPGRVKAGSTPRSKR